MPGLPSIWPDNPADRVKLVVEPIRSPFSVEYVADRAETDVETARRELNRLEAKGWVEQVCDSDEWRVNDGVRGEDGLFPDDELP